MRFSLLVVLTFLCAQLSVAQVNIAKYEHDLQTLSKDDIEYVFAFSMLLRGYSSEKDTTKLVNLCHSILPVDQASFAPLIKNGRRFRDPIRDDKLTNQAAETLSKVFERRGIVDSALYYLSLSDTLYGYITDCGNDYYMHRINNACRYAEMYHKKGNDAAAMNALLKEALNHESDKHLKKLLPYLSACNKQQLKKDLNNAINEFKFGEQDGYTEYYITFMKVKSTFYFYDDDATGSENKLIEDAQRKKVVDYLKQSTFYKMVMAM